MQIINFYSIFSFTATYPFQKKHGKLPRLNRSANERRNIILRKTIKTSILWCARESNPRHVDCMATCTDAPIFTIFLYSYVFLFIRLFFDRYISLILTQNDVNKWKLNWKAITLSVINDGSFWKGAVSRSLVNVTELSVRTVYEFIKLFIPLGGRNPTELLCGLNNIRVSFSPAFTR